ncbi:hypothetical protein [Xanthobacter sp. AM33]|uniref:hypothetical protein n=1 Tax=Xanthobacter TaxID=279 RepID=UPI0039BF9486
MMAFTIEVLLLLALAFSLGLALGFKLGRRRAAVVAEREGGLPPVSSGVLPVREVAPPGVLPFAAASFDAPANAPVPGAPDHVPARPAPTSSPREPDLFSRLGLSPGMVSLPRDPEDEEPPRGPVSPRPAPAPVVVREKGPDGHPGVRPPTLEAPEGAGADDLKLLKGIGPQNERRLNALGIYHFRQIAAWTPDEAAWVGSYLAFPGRIEREDWIGQAKARAAGEPPAAPDREEG